LDAAGVSDPKENFHHLTVRGVWVADVAAFLQTDRASVRRMTGEGAQHLSHHPIPFVKIGGKMLRFSRPSIEAWWNELCASKNGKSNTSALALPKGKVKKNGRD
jgi:predicted DNA-binding transcriptional regulator AlpA